MGAAVCLLFCRSSGLAFLSWSFLFSEVGFSLDSSDSTSLMFETTAWSDIKEKGKGEGKGRAEGQGKGRAWARTRAGQGREQGREQRSLGTRQTVLPDPMVLWQEEDGTRGVQRRGKNRCEKGRESEERESGRWPPT